MPSSATSVSEQAVDHQGQTGALSHCQSHGQQVPQRRLPIGAEVQPDGGVHFRVWAAGLSHGRRRHRGTCSGWFGRRFGFRFGAPDGSSPERGQRLLLRLRGRSGRCFALSLSSRRRQVLSRPGLAISAEGTARPFPGGRSRQVYRWTRRASGRGWTLEGQVLLRAALGHLHARGNLERRGRAPAAACRSWESRRSRSCRSPSSRARSAGAMTASISLPPIIVYGTPDDMRRFVDRRPCPGAGGHPRRRLQPFRTRRLLSSTRSPTTTCTMRGRERLGRRAELRRSRQSDRCASTSSPTPATGSRNIHLDGLRLDATHAIHDASQPHILAEHQSPRSGRSRRARASSWSPRTSRRTSG